MFKFLKKPTKKTLKRINNFVLVLVGNLILAAGSSLFMTQLNIVTGGLTGIGIIVQHIFGDSVQVIDITVFIFTWILWVLGLIFVGKDFALKTLVSSIIYPIFLFICLRLPLLTEIASDIAYGSDGSAVDTVGRTLLCGIFGGVAVGFGCGLTFLGGGSTGGVDIISFILEKHFKIKASVSVFFIDATIVLVGMLTIRNYTSSLVGIIGAFLCGSVIEVIYAGSQSCYIAEIISDKWEEISSFVQNEFDRGATILEAKGGYKGDQRVILRIVFDKTQYVKIRATIEKLDPKAFVTYTQTNAVFGEGFSHKILKKSAENE